MDAPVFAKFHRIDFLLDMDAGWYIRQPQPIHFAKVPGKLKIERTQLDRFRQQGAEMMIVGPMRENRRTFHTGLRTLPVHGWFIGNDYELRNGKKVLSLVLFEFSADNAGLTLYYFHGFYRDDRENREQYAVAFITYHQRQGAA